MKTLSHRLSKQGTVVMAQAPFSVTQAACFSPKPRSWRRLVSPNVVCRKIPGKNIILNMGLVAFVVIPSTREAKGRELYKFKTSLVYLASPG